MIFAVPLSDDNPTVNPPILTYFLIGGSNTLPIYIYTQIKFGITPEVNALASVLLAGSLTLLALAFALPQLVRATRKALKARTA